MIARRLALTAPHEGDFYPTRRDGTKDARQIPKAWGRQKMGVVRKIVKWIGGHRILSVMLAVLVILPVGYIWVRIVRSEGIVSEPLKRGTIFQSVYGIGTVTAAKSFQIKSGVTQTINAAFVVEGDTVAKGARLLTIDNVVRTAPFAGTITSLPNKVGENVFIDVPVLILVDLLDRYVVVSLEQQGALRILRGQKAVLSFDTMRNSNFEGEVKSVYSNATNFLARINIPNFPPKIMPGMTADVAITIDKHDNVLLLPIAALEGGKYVWVKTFGSKKVEVKVGFVDKAFAEVLSGDLHEGDRVLIRKQAAP